MGSANADDSLDTKKWLKKQKKEAAANSKKMALRRARDMEEQDAAVYDESECLYSCDPRLGADEKQEISQDSKSITGLTISKLARMSF